MICSNRKTQSNYIKGNTVIAFGGLISTAGCDVCDARGRLRGAEVCPNQVAEKQQAKQKNRFGKSSVNEKTSEIIVRRGAV